MLCARHVLPWGAAVVPDDAGPGRIILQVGHLLAGSQSQEQETTKGSEREEQERIASTHLPYSGCPAHDEGASRHNAASRVRVAR